MKAQTYPRLRRRMREFGMNQAELAERVHMGVSSLSLKFCGRRDWSLSEAWEVANALNIPADQFHLYFPPEP